MTRVAVTAACLLLAGCGSGGTSESAQDRAVAVYSAVIRHMTAEEGQASGFPIVYVLDRLMENAADPDNPSGDETPLSGEQQARLREALEDTAPIEFVGDEASVIGPESQGSAVRDGGILITLGPISGEGDRVEVPASSYLGNLAASWQTWLVERADDGWRVTGTTGPVAVS